VLAECQCEEGNHNRKDRMQCDELHGRLLSPADAVVVLLALGLVHRDVPGAGETARADEGQLRVPALSAAPEEGDPETVSAPHAILEALDTVETHMTLHENLRLDQVAGLVGR